MIYNFRRKSGTHTNRVQSSSYPTCYFVGQFSFNSISIAKYIVWLLRLTGVVRNPHRPFWDASERQCSYFLSFIFETNQKKTVNPHIPTIALQRLLLDCEISLFFSVVSFRFFPNRIDHFPFSFYFRCTTFSFFVVSFSFILSYSFMPAFVCIYTMNKFTRLYYTTY